MRLITLSSLVLVSHLIVSQGVFAQYEETTQNQSELTVPERVYIQTNNSNDISREGENCFYNDEHQHIHCYEDERFEDKSYRNENISHSKTRVVYRTSNRTYGDRYYTPSALSIGLAIGIPLLLHSSYHHDAYRYSYRSHNRHYRSHYRSHHRKSHHRGHH